MDEKLLEMAKEIRTQDNDCTHEPIFMVQRHRRTYGFDPDYTDDDVYVTADDYSEVSLEERKEEYAAAMADDDVDADDKDLDITPRDEWLKVFYPGALEHMKYMDYMRAFYAGRTDGSVSDDEKLKSREEWAKTYVHADADTDELRETLYAQHVERCKETHFEEWCDNNESYTKTAYQDTWENVQPFFTRKGAEEYLRINGHNLTGKKPPRIYTESAYRNAEWIAIRKMLQELNLAPEAPETNEPDADDICVGTHSGQQVVVRGLIDIENDKGCIEAINWRWGRPWADTVLAVARKRKKPK